MSGGAAVAAALDGLIAAIAAGAWFAACGAALGLSEREDLAWLAAGLGCGDVPVTPLADWHEAAAVAQRPDWSRLWWEREAAAEAALKERAAATIGAARQRDGLSRVALAAAMLAGPASQALARGGIADEALARVAAGAAAMACHQAALAVIGGGAREHVFAVKFRIFTAGHFPLGVVGGQFFVL